MIARESLTRIKNDGNGNPRFVIHFLNFITRAEKCAPFRGDLYEVALKRSRKLGGRKFHNKQYGGGIAFQSYNTDNLLDRIQVLMSDLNAIELVVL